MSGLRVYSVLCVLTKGAEPPFETLDERGGTAMNLTD